MSTSATPSSSNPAGDDRNLVPVDATTAATFEDKLTLFWRNNRAVVVGLCVVVLLAIVGRGAWQYFAKQKELEVEKAYADATTPEQLKAFAAAHSGHSLAGIAQLRLADDAYAAGKSADALASYDSAIGALKTGPLAARAQLGRALAKAQAGKTAEAAADLKQIANDANQLKAIRVEASYHLVSVAVDAANADDAQKFLDQLTQLDPAGPWTQRAMMLRGTLPATPAAGSATPTATPKKDEAAPGVQLKLPGK